MHSQQQKTAGRSLTMSSIKWLSFVIAVMITFLAVGPLYDLTQDWVRDFSIAQYGLGAADMSTFVWGGLCFVLTFFGSMAVASTVLTIVFMKVIERFF